MTPPASLHLASRLEPRSTRSSLLHPTTGYFSLHLSSAPMPLLEVKIPPLGESISSGILAKWHVKDGDAVTKDQPLFELETDKITSEGMAEAAGKISLKVAVGEEVKIGQIVATIDPGVSHTQS